ncbi:hypothetical protein BDP27DRAFT_517376 [Rhodocollybia butyracea]|uniref:Uncharacterized protein n=1 Tax=Rhodocollybia butyracea TaxID=206335 RepID=A0A9P5U9X4_9AGAR|nr:hypothetical protein BDP27DRAFT_517376 [Rhodocollybia butyracea]
MVSGYKDLGPDAAAFQINVNAEDVDDVKALMDLHSFPLALTTSPIHKKTTPPQPPRPSRPSPYPMHPRTSPTSPWPASCVRVPASLKKKPSPSTNTAASMPQVIQQPARPQYPDIQISAGARVGKRDGNK